MSHLFVPTLAIDSEPSDMDLVMATLGVKRFWYDVDGPPHEESIRLALFSLLVNEGVMAASLSFEKQREPAMRGTWYYAFGDRPQENA